MDTLLMACASTVYRHVLASNLGKLTIAAPLLLAGCAQTTTIGALTVDSVTGVFDPSVTLATARDSKGNITLQQVVAGPGAGQIIYNGAAQVGASAVFGIGAAGQYRPSRTNVTNNNGNANTTGSSAGNYNANSASNANANAASSSSKAKAEGGLGLGGNSGSYSQGGTGVGLGGEGGKGGNALGVGIGVGGEGGKGGKGGNALGIGNGYGGKGGNGYGGNQSIDNEVSVDD